MVLICTSRHPFASAHKLSTNSNSLVLAEINAGRKDTLPALYLPHAPSFLPQFVPITRAFSNTGLRKRRKSAIEAKIVFPCCKYASF